MFLHQAQLTALHALTRLVLATPYSVNISEIFDSYEDPDRQPPADAVDALAQLTNLRSLQLTPHRWLFGLRQLQPLSACRHLTELVLSELAMGFAADARRLDEGGSQLSAQEKALVKAAAAAAAASGAAGSSGDSSSQAVAATTIGSPAASRPAAAAGATARMSASGPTSPISGVAAGDDGGGSKLLEVAGLQVCWQSGDV